ncbi:endonuclease/exonuclease/phosphatase family protein [Georgenia muralis]|uniref:Endonuclease/exonuclease/phosphatase family metal-dependent hydrolase n=1 Tax=Georgenia muralis TaxID=154117 RepID=A0A3N4ZXD6_9MICO|nr:endonuclease/exonuclease/phosphatase family protein [Georgenia muralis]RPF25685.1 endonuclease/exonuclease/phosphatase family metal-dependent hydrolase [Georgenia muralis]
MRIATFNILHGRSLADDRVDLARFERAVRTLDADVLALQEVDRDQPRSHGADLTAMAAAALGAPEHRFVATMHGTPGLWTAATGDEAPEASVYGIALLTRHPVEHWRVLHLPGPSRRVPVLFPGRRRPVLVKDELRTAVAAVVAAREGTFTVVATHLTFVPGWNVAQLRHLVREVRGLPRPLVLLGDLNMAGGRPARYSGLRPLVTAPTFPLDRPDQQLDHILADGEMTVTGEGRSLDLGMSDHRALVVDVALPGPPAAGPREPGGHRVAGPAPRG